MVGFLLIAMFVRVLYTFPFSFYHYSCFYPRYVIEVQ